MRKRPGVTAKRGVVYMLSGMRAAERLIVSLYTLRQHWTGPVTVFCGGDDEATIAKKFGQGVEAIRFDAVKLKRHSSYANKTIIPSLSPYQHSVFIDADTAIVGKFDEMFGSVGLTLTAFSDWNSKGKRVTSRVNAWRNLTPAIEAMAKQQVETRHVALNTGVFGFRRGHPGLAEWHAITQVGAGRCHFTDEIAMQMLFPHIECEVLDDRYNCSPLYGVHSHDVRIWHFHGSKHLRKVDGKRLWWPLYQECARQNVAGIAEWGGRFDKDVKKELKEPKGLANAG